jgi:hypothetical protein
MYFLMGSESRNKRIGTIQSAEKLTKKGKGRRAAMTEKRADCVHEYEYLPSNTMKMQYKAIKRDFKNVH